MTTWRYVFRFTLRRMFLVVALIAFLTFCWLDIGIHFSSFNLSDRSRDFSLFVIYKGDHQWSLSYGDTPIEPPPNSPEGPIPLEYTTTYSRQLRYNQHVLWSRDFEVEITPGP